MELILQKEGDAYYIEWLRDAMIKRAKNNEIQRQKIQKYWDDKKNRGNTVV